MDEQQLIDLLTQNISYQLRHPNYDRTVDVARDCRMITTGEGQEHQITRYRRWEQDELKAQRIRLNNPITPIFISEPDKMFDKLTRVDGVRRELSTDNEKSKAELETTLWNFQPGTDIEAWIVNKARYLGKNDPNAYILFDRYDKRRIDGEIEKTTLRPVTFRSTDVLNFEQDGEGVLTWILFRDFHFEYYSEGGYRKQRRLETYYLYTSQVCIKAREVSDKYTPMEGEMSIDIEVFPANDTGIETGETLTEKTKSRKPAAPPVNPAQSNTRRFLISTVEHGAGEVPAFCVGAYPDELTDQKTFVSWFWPGKPVLLDVIRDKQLHDVEMIIEAFRRRYEFSPVCEYETEDHVRCDKGWIQETESRHPCPSCKGSGIRPNFTTEQEVVRLTLPEDTGAGLMELQKLSFEEAIDTTLLTYLDSKMEVHRQRFLAAIFSGGLFTKPTGTESQTATETVEKTNMAADILRPFGLVVSKGYEMAFRVLAAYREYGEIQVNHSYPEQIDLLTLDQEIANFAAIQEVDIYESKVHQRHRILAKQFEGEPDTHKRIQARYRFLPFDDKSPEQQAQILATLSPTDNNAILWAYWLQIFQEIEVSTPNFHNLKFEAQKTIVDAKVQEFKGRVELAGGGQIEIPDFNAPEDGNEPPNETGNE